MKNLYLFLIPFICAFFSCTQNSERKLIQSAEKQLEYALECTNKALQETKKQGMVVPRSTEKNGDLRLIGSRDWCSGFFPGSLWYMYEFTGDIKWKELANEYSLRIEKEKFDTTNHDVGFKMFCSFGNGYRLTQNSAYRDILFQSAETLSKRFDPTVGAIRSWDWNKDVWKYPVIIDNMMNLELLFWVAQESGDSTYYRIADTHAMTTLKNHFRADHSSYHVVDYDPETGEARLKQTHQGFNDNSTWSRGQAWGLYGFTMAYRFTKNELYLKKAKDIADFLFSHPNLAEDLVFYWDMNDPTIPNAPRDASASCITISALFELCEYLPDQKEHYLALARKVLSNLSDNYRAPLQSNHGFLLLHSTGHLPGNDEIDTPICYADYYYLEALRRSMHVK